jgi:hypothetical protein
MELEGFLLTGARAPVANGRSIAGVRRSIAQAGEFLICGAVCLLNGVPELEDSDDDGHSETETDNDTIMETTTPEGNDTSAANSVSAHTDGHGDSSSPSTSQVCAGCGDQGFTWQCTVPGCEIRLCVVKSFQQFPCLIGVAHVVDARKFECPRCLFKARKPITVRFLCSASDPHRISFHTTLRFISIACPPRRSPT